jgi:DNA-binding beta-propeller fold protein YncE
MSVDQGKNGLLRRTLLTGILLGIAAAGALVIIQGVGSARATKPERTYAGSYPAPEFPARLPWLNTGGRELTLESLRGKVVVLDFWNYGCISCVHVIRDLKRLQSKYGDALAVVGVHSGELAREKQTAAIRSILARYELEFPVVNDHDLAFRDAYGAKSLPTLVVVDPKGQFVGSVVGDNHFDLLDAVVGGLVAEFDAVDGIDRTPLPLEKEVPFPLAEVLRYPGKVLADADNGRLFIADTNNHRIVVTDLDGRIIETIGGREAGSEDGDFKSAEFRYPQGLALADPDTLYVADTWNNTIRRVDLAEERVETVVGTRERVFQVEDAGPANRIGLNSPWDVLWHDGLLYIAMAGQHQLWVYDPDSRQVKAFAGSRRTELRDGPLLEAGLNQPSGLATDGVRLFVADADAGAIRVTGFDSGARLSTVTRIPADPPEGSPAPPTKLQHPLGVAWLGDSVLVADTYNHRIRTLDPDTGRLHTLVGDDGGLEEPGGISVSGDRIYVADTNHHRIVAVDPESGAVTPVHVREAGDPASVRANRF